MDTLDVYRRSRDGRRVFGCLSLTVEADGSFTFFFLSPDSTQVLQVADALCAQLSSQDLAGSTAGGEREEMNVVPSPSCQTSANALLISC